MLPNIVPPPVNNACLPDIFSKLDANVLERKRVLNMQLTVKLQMQEKLILKYQNAAKVRYKLERDRVIADLKSINRRMPYYDDIPHLETKLKKLRKSRKAKPHRKHDCVFTTVPLAMKGIITEREDKLYCDRFCTHHLPAQSRVRSNKLGSMKKGISMPDLRSHKDDEYLGLQSFEHPHGNVSMIASKVLPSITSMDDFYVSSKSEIVADHDDDDTRTV